MAFRADVLERHPWTNHLTEDVELQLELLLEGSRVAFAPDAVVRAEMPATWQGSRSQHERWERGRLEMARRYLPRLVKQSLTRTGGNGRAPADAAVDQLMPPFSVLVAATAAWGVASAAGAVIQPGHRARRLLPVITVAGTQLVYVLSSLRMVSAPPAVYRSLVVAPRAVVWKVGLWFRMLVRRDVTWVRTARNQTSDLPVAPRANVTA
jgi:hypothetical protein